MYKTNKENSKIDNQMNIGTWPSVNHPSDLVVTKLCKGVNWLRNIPTTTLQVRLNIPTYVSSDLNQAERRQIVSEVVEYILSNFPEDADERITVTSLCKLFCQHPDKKINKSIPPKDKMMSFNSLKCVSIGQIMTGYDSTSIELESSVSESSTRMYKVEIDLRFTKDNNE